MCCGLWDACWEKRKERESATLTWGGISKTFAILALPRGIKLWRRLFPTSSRDPIHRWLGWKEKRESLTVVFFTANLFPCVLPSQGAGGDHVMSCGTCYRARCSSLFLFHCPALKKRKHRCDWNLFLGRELSQWSRNDVDINSANCLS